MDKAKWQKVKKGFNINELLKYKDILPCYFVGQIEVNEEHFIYEIDADDGYGCVLFKCKKDGSIVAIQEI
jgi:hypothetical protein